MNIEETLLKNHGIRDYNYKDIVRSMSDYGEQQQKVYYELVAKQAIEIDNLKNKIEILTDSVKRRQDWIDNAKDQVGVNYVYSFDKIWARVLDEFNKGNINFENL